MNVTTGEALAVRARRALGGMRRDAEEASREQGSRRRRAASGDEKLLHLGARLQSQIRGLEQARRAVGEGLSAVQTAEGSLSRMGELLQVMQEVAGKASVGELGRAERAAMQRDFKALVLEIDRIARDTRYGEQTLLDGAAGELSVRVGLWPEAERITVPIHDLRPASLGGARDGLEEQSVSTAPAAARSLSVIEGALAQVEQQRVALRDAQARLDHTLRDLGDTIEGLMQGDEPPGSPEEAKEAALELSAALRARPAASLQAQANLNQQSAGALLTW
jgi:flagellin